MVIFEIKIVHILIVKENTNRRVFSLSGYSTLMAGFAVGNELFTLLCSQLTSSVWHNLIV